jgi:rhamnosyltransferase
MGAEEPAVTSRARNVCGVVSAFNPGPENVANIECLQQYVEHEVVLDDG